MESSTQPSSKSTCLENFRMRVLVVDFECEYIFRGQTLHFNMNKISCRHLLHKLEPLFLKLFI